MNQHDNREEEEEEAETGSAAGERLSARWLSRVLLEKHTIEWEFCRFNTTVNILKRWSSGLWWATNWWRDTARDWQPAESREKISPSSCERTVWAHTSADSELREIYTYINKLSWEKESYNCEMKILWLWRKGQNCEMKDKVKIDINM